MNTRNYVCRWYGAVTVYITLYINIFMYEEEEEEFSRKEQCCLLRVCGPWKTTSHVVESTSSSQLLNVFWPNMTHQSLFSQHLPQTQTLFLFLLSFFFSFLFKKNKIRFGLFGFCFGSKITLPFYNLFFFFFLNL